MHLNANGLDVRATLRKFDANRATTTAELLVLQWADFRVCLPGLVGEGRSMAPAAQIDADPLVTPMQLFRGRQARYLRAKTRERTVLTLTLGCPVMLCSASLSLAPHALAPVADLRLLEVLSAKRLVADLTLGLDKVVFNYFN